MEQVFPFPKSIFKGSFKKADPKDVEDYVNRVMESVFGSNHAAQFPFRDPLPKKKNQWTPLQRSIYSKQRIMFL